MNSTMKIVDAQDMETLRREVDASYERMIAAEKAKAFTRWQKAVKDYGRQLITLAELGSYERAWLEAGK